MIFGSSYSLQDFVPFTADIYFRLLERMGETYWPLHLITIVLGMVALWLVLKQRLRLACLLIAPVWLFVAVAFFIGLYAELNWAGGYIAFAFLIQSALLLFLALTGIGLDDRSAKSHASIVGTFIALAGLIGLPVIGLLSDASGFRAEVFGIHADPTSMTTLGLAIMISRGWLLWCISLIPALWLLYSGLTLWALGAPSAKLLLVVLFIALAGLFWKQLELSILKQDSHDQN